MSFIQSQTESQRTAPAATSATTITTTTTATSQERQNWGSWTDELIEQEQVVWRNNLPLAVVSSLVAGAYSYYMIDGNANNAVNRGLLMTLSTLLGASVVDVLQNNGYLDTSGNMPMAVEAVAVPLIYFWINNKQFKLPDLQSQVIKTGFIASVAGQLATPYVRDYLNRTQ